MNNTNFTINKITLNKSSVDIIWNDNHTSHFHFLWLRDNCPTSFHPDTRMRKFNILNVSKDIHPIDWKITGNGNLHISWSENNHISIFDSKWLRDNCYTRIKNKANLAPYILWDSSFKKKLNLLTIEYQEIIDSDEGLKKWLEALNSYGLTIIKNTPIEKNSALKILKRISHIRETFFGTPFEVINIPKPNNQAYTSDALTSHTDLPYYEYTPGYQFLHCLENKAKGGESTVIDGFRVASDLKNNDMAAFNLLLKIPIMFKDNDYTQDKTRHHYSPIINLSNLGDFIDIRFNMGAMGTLNIKHNLMKKYYDAYRIFADLVHKKKYLLSFKLKKGDILSFNNRRILHGRTSFDPNSGHRHLQGYYLDKDEIISRLNYLRGIIE
jgi:gamma-butyrobetaine dioxygenase